jgi:hypothetical protein
MEDLRIDSEPTADGDIGPGSGEQAIAAQPTIVEDVPATSAESSAENSRARYQKVGGGVWHASNSFMANEVTRRK